MLSTDQRFTQGVYGATGAVAALWAIVLIVTCQKDRCASASLREWLGFKKGQGTDLLFVQRRLERFARFLRIAVTFVVPGILGLLFLANATRQRSDPDLVVNIMTIALGWIVCLALLLGGMFHSSVTNMGASLGCGIVYLLVALPPPFAASPMTYRSRSALSCLTQLFLSQLYPDRRMSVLLNLLSLAWQLVSIFLVPALREQAPGNLQVVVLSCIFCVAVSFSMASVLEAESEASLRQGEAQAGLRSLLSVMCDSVVALRADLTLAEPSPSLQSMLIRSKTGLARRKFADFLSPADLIRFEDFVDANSQQEYVAKTIHVDLMDSMGCKVPVQIFHTCLAQSGGDGPRHWLGIAEDKEREHFDAAARTPSKVKQGNQDPSAVPVLAEERPSMVRSSSLERSKSLLTVSPDPPHPVLKVNLAARAIWNVDSANLIGRPFRDWLEDPEAFTSWLQHGIREARNIQESFGASFGPTVVRPPDSVDQAHRTMLVMVKIHIEGFECSRIEIELRKVVQASAVGTSIGRSLSSGGIGVDPQWETPEEAPRPGPPLRSR